MSMRHAVKVRGGAAVVTAAALALTLAGCGGGGDKPQEPQKSSAASQPGSSPQAPAPNGSQSPAPTQILATVNGPSSTVLTINSAARDQGGFLTVNGQIKNGGSEAFVETAAWRGDERSASAASVAGVTLIDKAGKKRYYVLRDTEGRCLCTIGLTRIGAGESVPFFAQFPAPPANVTEVDFNLPTFATATIKISG
ncbi:hypothetical protein OHS33_23335 [Streptomyces sp. NBC_00536]|uniref:hypothetical protein n=1 Tax=Streptomyces sp. NBC_00536 TaxID=2975769 RepID=UPI002E819145|nr:hypothetical protein [Streptomyces sp. NBC_00536]WUC81008.1 hypothetical protein OHS33_23335 [Streptomyces sp. NBC_00536]